MAKVVGNLPDGTDFTWYKDSRVFTKLKNDSNGPYVWVSWWSEGIRHTGEMHIGEQVQRTPYVKSN